MSTPFTTLVERALREPAHPVPPGCERLVEPFARLLELVEKWDAAIDLTAAKSREELVDLYLPDALVLASFAEADDGPAVDVGSGGGAPGVPLAMLRPELALTLVEPRAKRVAFLRQALMVAERRDVAVVRARSDTLAPGTFSLALSRATLPPAEWLVEGRRLARRVWLLLSKAEPPALGDCEVKASISYRWTFSGAERHALLLEKK